MGRKKKESVITLDVGEKEVNLDPVPLTQPEEPSTVTQPTEMPPVSEVVDWPSEFEEWEHIAEQEIQEEVKVIAKEDPFLRLSAEFYSHLEELRKEYESNPDSKVLIANAGAYVTKALRAVDLIRKLELKWNG